MNGSLATLQNAPDWLPSQMPPGYQTRFAEIQRLTAELSGMDRLGRLLWESGAELSDAVMETFTALKVDTNIALGNPEHLVGRLDGKRSLLIHVSSTGETIEKRDPALAHLFQLLHTVAGPDDRVVLAVNPHRTIAPTGRPDALTAEALALVTRIGVNVLPTATLFGAWTLANSEPARVRAWIERLHTQDGGVVRAPGS